MSTVHQHSERAESQDKGNLILALCWSFTALGATFVTLRLFVQTTIRRSIRSEDCWSVFTIVRTFQTSSTVDLFTHGTLSRIDLHYFILYSIDDFCLLRQWETLRHPHYGTKRRRHPLDDVCLCPWDTIPRTGKAGCDCPFDKASCTWKIAPLGFMGVRKPVCCNTGHNRLPPYASMLATKGTLGLLSPRRVFTCGSPHKYVILSWQ